MPSDRDSPRLLPTYIISFCWSEQPSLFHLHWHLSSCANCCQVGWDRVRCFMLSLLLLSLQRYKSHFSFLCLEESANLTGCRAGGIALFPSLIFPSIATVMPLLAMFPNLAVSCCCLGGNPKVTQSASISSPMGLVSWLFKSCICALLIGCRARP